MLKNRFEIRDEGGGYLRLEQAGIEVDLTLKTTNVFLKRSSRSENYFIEHLRLTPESVRALIEALEEAIS